MDEVISAVKTRAGLSQALAERAVAILLHVIREEAEESVWQPLFDTFEEAEAYADEGAASDDSDLDDQLGEHDDMTEAASRLAAAGLDEEATNLAIRAFIETIEDTLGEEATAEIVEAVPALSNYS